MKKEARNERNEHHTIEIGGQIIGKPGGRGKPPGWGTAQGRYSTGGNIPLPGFDGKEGLAESASDIGEDIKGEGEGKGEGGEEEDSGKVDPETGLPVYRPVHTGGRKRPRVVEADWLATNTVLTGKRNRDVNEGDAKDSKKVAKEAV